jgi:hypothetical protein
MSELAANNESVGEATTSTVPAPTMVTLDDRAVLARINRALAKQHQHLRKCRSDSAAYRKLGGYYLVSTEPTVQIVRTRVKLAVIAEELGVLEPFEQVA